MKYVRSKSFAINILKLSFFLLLSLLWFSHLYAYQASDFAWIPPFQSQDEKPSITIIFDNSGSMNERAYAKMNFDSQVEYYGYFDPYKYYTYHSNGYFVEATTAGRHWSGNFLNWAAMLRIDVGKKVMTGGEYSSGKVSFTQLRDNLMRGTTDQSNDCPAITINDSVTRKDLNGQQKYLTTLTRNNSNISVYRTNNERKIKVGGTNYNLIIQQDPQEGVVQKFADSARMSLFFYESDQGALIQEYMGDGLQHANNIVNAINDLNGQKVNMWTPLAESLYTVIGYISQNNNNLYEYNLIEKKNQYKGPRYKNDSSYKLAQKTTPDPYYFDKYKDDEYKGLVYCTKQSVILITDGEPTQDNNIPDFILTNFKNKIGKNSNQIGSYSFGTGGSPYLIDVAYYGRTTDLRDGNAFPGAQNIELLTVYASFGEGSSQFLKDATMFGSFKTKEQLNTYLANTDTMEVDNYFEAQTGDQLEEAVFAAFASATKSTSSGTAAAVSPQSSDGEGAVFQAVFFPPVDGSEVAPPWSGHLHALFIDEKGYIREDTKQTRKLCTDVNDPNYSKIVSTLTVDSILDLKPIWSSTQWLNNLDDDEVVVQRSSYANTSNNRYVFTFVDKNNDMVVNDGEIQNFITPESGAFDLGNPNYFYNYLTLYDCTSLNLSFQSGCEINALRLSDNSKYENFLAQRTQEQVDFIRGADVPNNLSSFTVSQSKKINESVRSRKLVPDGKTWRLGDIIYSTPVSVGGPTKNYDLVYNDRTYVDFFKKYRKRRQVVYVGANDGMLHAFNAGFYNGNEKSFELSLDGEEEYSLGMELWAYVPYNLLPHLRWLMNPDYGADLHVSYMDLPPKVFEARIFFESDGITPIDNDRYPNGWGTILVAGMRLGGPTIQADLDKDGVFNNNDRTMSSAYVIIDITDPEQPPNVLAEIKMPRLGFTTCEPEIMPMSTPNTQQNDKNQWFLIFGSGPADENGSAASDKMETCISRQPGRLFIVDLKHLVTKKEIRTLNDNGEFKTVRGYFENEDVFFAQTEAHSFISSPIAGDFDVGKVDGTEMKTDAVYYGTISGNDVNNFGKMYRLVTRNKMPSSNNWTQELLIDIQEPITAPATLSRDDKDNIWVYFGTGKFYNLVDGVQSSSRGFYGIKEPMEIKDGKRDYTWGEVKLTNLYNSADITVGKGTCLDGSYNKLCVEVKKGGSTILWDTLVAEVTTKAGWKQIFDVPNQLIINKAAIAGGAVIFTSYTPSLGLCEFGGSSNLCAYYMTTGTGYYKPILPDFRLCVSLGDGLAAAPYIKRLGNGKSVPIVQKSDGTIIDRSYVPDDSGKLVPVDPDALGADPDPLINEPHGESTGALFWQERTDLKNPD